MRKLSPAARALAPLLWILCLAGEALAAPLLYVVREFDPELRVVDASNAATLSTQTLTLAGETVLGSSGLARDPLSGALYGLLFLDGQAGRELVTIDPATGVATSVGDTGAFFSALAFDAAGTLYGVTHDDSVAAEELYTLSLANGFPSFVTALGNGGYGEALGFDPADGLLYHASGYPGDDPVFETLDPGNGFLATGLALSGDPFDEVLALAPDGAGGLYMTDYLGLGGVSNLYAFDPGTASVTLIGGLGFSDARGLVLVPEPSTALLVLVGLGGIATLRRARR
jgi:hypothetical protein